MLRVLIVDDHALFRDQARALLQADGLTVVGEARDGTSAVAAARELKPDIVLLDVGLPDMDGFAVTDALRSVMPRIQIVLTSSRSADSFGTRIRDSRATGFLAKEEVSGTALRALIAK
jgi:DNA-binding NarL/FixJ family response regulator